MNGANMAAVRSAARQHLTARVAFQFVLAFIVVAPLMGLGPLDHQRPPAAVAQSLQITIPVYDYTSNWRPALQAGVQRWDAALAPRGIRLTYSPQSPAVCEGPQQPTSGISACDSTLSYGDERWADGEEQAIWVENGEVQVRGLIRFYEDPPDDDFADMVICHEIGHTLQLQHVPEGSDSCMTPIPGRIAPSSWDAANALWSIPDAPTLTPAPPVDNHQDKERERQQKKKEKQREKKERKHQNQDGHRQSQAAQLRLLHATHRGHGPRIK
jgi:hypothetical protein